MLASILPGFRQVRTPLLTGYLYLASLWLTFGDSMVPSANDEGAPGKVAQLFDLLGPVAATATVSVAAYLLGSALVIHRWPLLVLNRISNRILWSSRIVRNRIANPMLFYPEELSGLRPAVRIVVRSGHPKAWLIRHLAWVDGALLRLPKSLTLRAIREDRDDFGGLANALDSWLLEELSADVPESTDRRIQQSLEVDPNQPIPPHFLPDGYVAYVLPEDLGRVAANLRVSHPALWDEYDRRLAEAELRYSIAAPLTVICVTATLTWTPWAVLALLIPLILVWQGYRSECSSVTSIADVIDAGIVTPPLLTALRRLGGWVEDNDSKRRIPPRLESRAAVLRRSGPFRRGRP